MLRRASGSNLTQSQTVFLIVGMCLFVLPLALLVLEERTGQGLKWGVIFFINALGTLVAVAIRRLLKRRRSDTLPPATQHPTASPFQVWSEGLLYVLLKTFLILLGLFLLGFFTFCLCIGWLRS